MGKFVVKKVNTGIKFDLHAANGEIIATSQVYTTKAACLKGIASVQHNADTAVVEDQTVEGFASLHHPKFEIFKDAKGEFRFHLKASNGQIVAVSQAYTEKHSCEKGIASVQKNAPEASIEHTEDQKQ